MTQKSLMEIYEITNEIRRMTREGQTFLPQESDINHLLYEITEICKRQIRK